MDIDKEIEFLERDERALEKAGEALTRLATIAEKFYAKLYPERKDVRDATITILEAQQEKDQRERLQGSETTTAEWADLGPRERKLAEAERKPRT